MTKERNIMDLIKDLTMALIRRDKKALTDYKPICSPCAKSAGADWPDKRVATFSMQRCSICDKDQACCEIRDWRWPEGRPVA